MRPELARNIGQEETRFGVSRRDPLVEREVEAPNLMVPPVDSSGRRGARRRRERGHDCEALTVTLTVALTVTLALTFALTSILTLPLALTSTGPPSEQLMKRASSY